ncbi:hypothetical protein CRI93_12580 [Longimonas halophila]|uniref:Inhibitor I9 domain-containing protein n=1 Tax=Longimonas halophila TaxID=1469170 RepID=A0A2H3NIZ5_9BACT|nr:protease inhibitor I9 family protein [Longimonas halophila]PEN05527.1 hypothetical protein CRI93_12580 [Longimonas halophila]
MRLPYCVIPIAATLSFLSFAGCSTNVENDLPCSDPAPLHGSPSEEIEGFIVVYQDDRAWTEEEVESTTNELATQYEFMPEHIYTASRVSGFSANFSAEALDGLRCEPVVRYVEYDMQGEIAS